MSMNSNDVKIAVKDQICVVGWPAICDGIWFTVNKLTSDPVSDKVNRSIDNFVET